MSKDERQRLGGIYDITYKKIWTSDEEIEQAVQMQLLIWKEVPMSPPITSKTIEEILERNFKNKGI